MKDPQVVLRYTRALLGLVQTPEELVAMDQNFIHVRELLDRHPEINHLVLNSTISKPEKKDFLEKVFPSDMPRILIHFLMVLVEKGRFAQIRYIQEEFHRLAEKKQGIREVQVVTATPLSSANEKKLIAMLEKKLKAKIRLIPETNSQILGGMILRFDGTEINASFRERLTDLQQALMR